VSETPVWVLTTQADMDTCADGLEAAGFATTVERRPDANNWLIIHIPDRKGQPERADLGQVVIIPFGTPMVVSYEAYAASPYFEET
jgi:hypothetical protein